MYALLHREDVEDGERNLDVAYSEKFHKVFCQSEPFLSRVCQEQNSPPTTRNSRKSYKNWTQGKY